MNIQQTTVTPTADDRTRVELQISASAEIGDAEDYILISVEIPHSVSGKRLEWLQHHALDQVLQSLGGIAEELARALQP